MGEQDKITAAAMSLAKWRKAPPVPEPKRTLRGMEAMRPKPEFERRNQSVESIWESLTFAQREEYRIMAEECVLAYLRPVPEAQEAGAA